MTLKEELRYTGTLAEVIAHLEGLEKTARRAKGGSQLADGIKVALEVLRHWTPAPETPAPDPWMEPHRDGQPVP